MGTDRGIVYLGLNLQAAGTGEGDAGIEEPETPDHGQRGDFLCAVLLRLQCPEDDSAI